MFLVEILSSYCGRGGCHWYFLSPFNLRHSPCGFLYNHLYCPPMTPLQLWYILAVMAVDCGDEIPSKSKPQPAGVTSCANFENVLHLHCFSLQYVFTLQFSIFVVEVLSPNVLFYCIFREFCKFSSDSLFKPCLLLIMRHCTH